MGRPRTEQKPAPGREPARAADARSKRGREGSLRGRVRCRISAGATVGWPPPPPPLPSTPLLLPVSPSIRDCASRHALVAFFCTAPRLLPAAKPAQAAVGGRVLLCIAKFILVQ